MCFIVVLIIVVIDCLIIYFIKKSKLNSPEICLNNKFVSLGNVKGKDYKDIVGVVGTENSVSTMKNGCVLREWFATGYYIALLFDENDACMGVYRQELI